MSRAQVLHQPVSDAARLDEPFVPAHLQLEDSTPEQLRTVLMRELNEAKSKKEGAAIVRRFVHQVMLASKGDLMFYNGHSLRSKHTDVAVSYAELHNRQQVIDNAGRDGVYAESECIMALHLALDVNIEVYINGDPRPQEFKSDTCDDAPIRLVHISAVDGAGHKSEHYELRLENGRNLEIIGDGNCLFHAVHAAALLAQGKSVQDYKDLATDNKQQQSRKKWIQPGMLFSSNDNSIKSRRGRVLAYLEQQHLNLDQLTAIVDKLKQQPGELGEFFKLQTHENISDFGHDFDTDAQNLLRDHVVDIMANRASHSDNDEQIVRGAVAEALAEMRQASQVTI